MLIRKVLGGHVQIVLNGRPVGQHSVRGAVLFSRNGRIEASGTHVFFLTIKRAFCRISLFVK